MSGATPTKSKHDDPGDEQDYGNNPQCMDCKPESPKDQCKNQQHENYAHWVLFPLCLRTLAVATSPSKNQCAPQVATIAATPVKLLTGEDTGIPDLQSRPEPFDLGYHHRDIGQLNFSSYLWRLISHELVDALEDCFFHGHDLGVDVLPEQRLFQRGEFGISLIIHAQRIVSAPYGRNNIWPIFTNISEVHGFGLPRPPQKFQQQVPIVARMPEGPQNETESVPLEGEDIDTEHWEDARHWMSIYDDLIRFKLGLLDRVQRELPKMHPVAQKAADVDVAFIETQMAGYYDRLDLWYQRVWKLQGLWLDPDGRVLRHKGNEAVLTNREFELLQFLLDHPHRFYNASQIAGFAWSDSALSPEEVRNYVSRVRKILARLEIPCDLVNRPGRGYSLTFRNQD